jgi:hypothetical protein
VQATDTLVLSLNDEDFVSTKVLGVGRVPLAGSEAVARPRHPVRLTLAVREQIQVAKPKKKLGPGEEEEGWGSAAAQAAAAGAGGAPSSAECAPPGSPGGEGKAGKKGGLFSRLR